jgi:hypothetical protein
MMGCIGRRWGCVGMMDVMSMTQESSVGVYSAADEESSARQERDPSRSGLLYVSGGIIIIGTQCVPESSLHRNYMDLRC